MIYIFTYLGEFGYELMNWQGTIRKFKKIIGEDDKIVVCGRKGLQAWYRESDEFIDISELENFKNTAAAGYTIHPDDISKYDTVKEEIRQHVISKMPELNNSEHQFIFSGDINHRNNYHNLQFGHSSIDPLGENIYAELDLNNNEFTKIIEDDDEIRKKLEKELGFDLQSENYILIQRAWRVYCQRSLVEMDEDILINKLSKNMKVVILDFDTGRRADSHSKFDGELKNNYYNISISGFKEQGCLISNSNACVFFTEGDFRSHIYVPPFMGVNVFAVAPRDVYRYADGRNTPIDFWNKNVFKFGGHIVPIEWEECTSNPTYLSNLVQSISSTSKKKSKLKIVTHILPWEIDEFNQSLIQFKRNSYYLDDDDLITFNVTLNLSDQIIDWENSKLPKEYFIDKFNLITQKLDWVNKKNIKITYSDECLSTSHNMMKNIHNCEEEAILWVDSDIYFPDHTLKTMIDSMDVIKNDKEYYILSPQSQRKWDSSWDCLANKRYLNDDYGYGLDLDVFELNGINEEIVNEISIKEIDTVKFGGGVFNLFSSNVMKFINIPDTYKTYGGVDTYIMQSALAMKEFGYDFAQYVVENLIVGEIHKYRLSDCGRSDVKFYKNYLSLLVDKNEERSKSESINNEELIKNIQRIKDNA